MSGFNLPKKHPQEPLEQYQMKVMKKIRSMGGKTTRALKKVLTDGEVLGINERDVFRRTLDRWEAYLVENYRYLGRLSMWPVGPDGTEVYHSIAMSLYWEISRMRVLIHKDDFPHLVEWKLSDHEHLVESLGSAGRVVDGDIGVMMYTQEEIRTTIFNLVEVINMIPYTEHFKEFVNLIDLKCSTFLCQTMSGTIINDQKFRMVQDMRPGSKPIKKKIVHEDENGDYMEEIVDEWSESDKRCLFNRDFWIFCTIYMTKIRRRFYYQSMIPQMDLQRPTLSYLPDQAIDRLKDWCTKLAVGLADNFDDRYKANCRQGYNFDGDKQWYDYKFPMSSRTVEAQVRKLRPETAVSFFSEDNVSRRSVINMTNQSYSACIFIIDLVDRYFRIYKDLNWRDGYVIFNEDIEESFDKLTTSKEPFLVQVFSSFWVYLGGKVLVADSIYAAICLWFLCVRKTRSGLGLPADTLLGNCNIGDVINRVLSPQDKEEEGIVTVAI